MTAKILKANGKIIHRSTYCSLTEQEWADEIETKTKQRQEFDEKVKVKLGQPMKASHLHDHSPDDMDDIEDMTAYDLYADDNGKNHQHAHESDPMPEAGDNYIGAQVLLPHRDQMMSGLVRNRKRDSMGNPSGVSHANLILDTRVYEVVFPDGEVTEYGANVIAENVWAQCDLDGKQQALLEAIVDHRANNTAVKPADQYVYVNG